MSQPPINWSQRNLEDLVDYYENEIHPEFEASTTPLDQPYPTATWVDDNGYGGLRSALKRSHNRTFKEFLTDDVGVDTESDDDSIDSWVRDDETAAAIAAYFRPRERRDLLAESTIASKRSRIKRWVRSYRRVHGHDRLLEAASDPNREPQERQRCREVLAQVEERYSTDASRLKFLSSIRSIYAWLQTEGYVEFNPVDGAQSEFEWSRETPDNPALSAQQVSRLYATATSLADQLLVVGLAAWGLRVGELSSLHRSQLALDDDDPHIVFEERKNGPGTVAILYGRRAVEDRIVELSDGNSWNGYLFPSSQSQSGHRASGTLRRRFRRLAETADVTVDGERPAPKMGRRFWYQRYSDAVTDVMQQLSKIADDQGSSSESVVWQNYHDEASRRQLRREAMADELAAAFE